MTWNVSVVHVNDSSVGHFVTTLLKRAVRRFINSSVSAGSRGSGSHWPDPMRGPQNHMTRLRLISSATFAVFCLTLVGCDHAEAKAAKCSALTLVSSGNEPELEWYSGILKSYLATYLFDLGKMKPGSDCTLETRLEGDLDRVKGYVHQSRVVQLGQVIWSYEQNSGESGRFISSEIEAFDMVAALDKAGIVSIPNRELLEPGDPQEIVDKLCARETVAPLVRDPQHFADTVLIQSTLYRVDDDPCAVFCEAFAAEWRGKTLQLKASINRKYLWAIFEGRQKGALRVRNSWTYTSPAITTPGYYERLISADSKDFRLTSTPVGNIIISREDSYRYSGGVVQESKIIKSDGKRETLVGLGLSFSVSPDRRAPYEFQDVLTVIRKCRKGITDYQITTMDTYKSPGTIVARTLNGGEAK